MKAAIFAGRKGELDLREVRMPAIGADQALLRIAYTGLCQTDVKKVRYNLLGIKENDPRVFGHEIVGEIVAAGSRVQNVSIGDRVALFHHVPCESCASCFSGRSAQCETYKTVDTDAGYGQASGGGFAEYIRIPSLVLAKGIIPIPDEISFEEAVFIEPVNCALKAVNTFKQYQPIQEDEPVLVVGQGHQGLIFDQLISLYGGKPIATDKRKSRVRGANRFAEAFSPKEVQSVAEDIDGFNKAIISAADSRAIDFALKMMKEGGVAVYFGDLMPGNEYWSYHSRHEIPVTIDGKLVVPSYSSSFQLHQEAADLIFGGRINVSDMVTQKVGLSDLEMAVQGAVKGFLRKGLRKEEVLKILIDPSKERAEYGSFLGGWLLPVTAGLAGAALVVSAGVLNYLKFSDCETVNNWNGTVSYTCPAPVNCGYLKSWEGEREEITPDGKKICTYWTGGN